MIDRVHFLTLMGSMLCLIGGCMAIWPRAVTSMSKDEDGNPIPMTPANIVWMRVMGIALFILGVVLIISGIVGVKGDPDPVLI